MKFEDVLDAVKISWRGSSSASNGHTKFTIVSIYNEETFHFGESCQPPVQKKKQDEFFVILGDKMLDVGKIEFQELGEDEGVVLFQYIRNICRCLREYLEMTGEQSLPTIPSMLRVFQALQEQMFDVGDVQKDILYVLEAYISQNRNKYDELVPAFLTGLLVLVMEEHSNGGSVKTTSVKRLAAVRGLFQKLDFTHTDSAWIRQQLLILAIQPSVMKLADGRKLLSALLCCEQSFTQTLQHQYLLLLSQCRAGVVDLLANIYYRAWTDMKTAADMSMINTLEQCIQEYISYSIDSAHEPLRKACLLLLETGFFEHKQANKQVDETLVRKSAPILWRALQAANPKVRINAISFLSAAFPLQYAPEGDLLSLEQQMQRQIDAFETALKDDDMNVRCHAVSCVSGILAKWWEVLVERTVKRLCTLIITDSAIDSTSPQIRAGAINGICNICVNPLSHPLLKVLLPKIGYLLFDPVDKVKLALLKLLEQLKTTRNQKWQDVCSQDDIMLAIATTKSDVVKKELGNFMDTSFFPTSDNTLLIEKALSLIKDAPTTARNFYASSNQQGNQKIKLACMLYKVVVLNYQFVYQNGKEVSPKLLLREEDILATLLVMGDLWRTSGNAWKDPQQRGFVQKFFKPEEFVKLYHTYEQHDAVVISMVTIAGFLEPTDTLETWQLTVLTKHPLYALPILVSFNRWKQLDQVLQGVCQSIANTVQIHLDSVEEHNNYSTLNMNTCIHILSSLSRDTLLLDTFLTLVPLKQSLEQIISQLCSAKKSNLPLLHCMLHLVVAVGTYSVQLLKEKDKLALPLHMDVKNAETDTYLEKTIDHASVWLAWCVLMYQTIFSTVLQRVNALKCEKIVDFLDILKTLCDSLVLGFFDMQQTYLYYRALGFLLCLQKQPSLDIIDCFYKSIYHLCSTVTNNQYIIDINLISLKKTHLSKVVKQVLQDETIAIASLRVSEDQEDRNQYDITSTCYIDCIRVLMVLPHILNMDKISSTMSNVITDVFQQNISHGLASSVLFNILYSLFIQLDTDNEDNTTNADTVYINTNDTKLTFYTSLPAELRIPHNLDAVTLTITEESLTPWITTCLFAILKSMPFVTTLPDVIQAVQHARISSYLSRNMDEYQATIQNTQKMLQTQVWFENIDTIQIDKQWNQLLATCIQKTQEQLPVQTQKLLAPAIAEIQKIIE